MLLLFLFGIGILFADFIHSRQEIQDGLLRNEYGLGKKKQRIRVEIDGEESTCIDVEIPEQEYADDEVKSMFGRCAEKLNKVMLGENQSFEHVDKNLNLVTKLEHMPVEISWEIDNYKVMNIYGELQQKNLSKEGALVNLTAIMTYTENKEKQEVFGYHAVVYAPKLTRREQLKKQLESILKKADAKSATKRKFMLPKKMGKKSLRYYPVFENRGIVMVIMALLISVLLIALQKQNKSTDHKKRESQMLQDYPEIINKLTLLLGAGMTVKRAWKKIVEDYEREKELWGCRFAYEEMRLTCNEMESGITEMESYERFGRRCKLQEYRKLGVLLSQNLRKGTRGISQILTTEAMQAFEERKARAKILGEEAGTKLLAPMFLMLAIVLIIVIVPAFLSIQM